MFERILGGLEREEPDMIAADVSSQDDSIARIIMHDIILYFWVFAKK